MKENLIEPFETKLLKEHLKAVVLPASMLHFFEVENEKEFWANWNDIKECICLYSTKYPFFCSCLAHAIHQMTIKEVAGWYGPAQDLVADMTPFFSVHSDTDASNYVNIVIYRVEFLCSHIAEGRNLGLTPLEISLHDMMWGFTSVGYDARFTEIAKELSKEFLERDYRNQKRAMRIIRTKLCEVAERFTEEDKKHYPAASFLFDGSIGDSYLGYFTRYYIYPNNKIRSLIYENYNKHQS